MTFFAQNRTSDFRLKRNVVVFAAVVADDLKFTRRVCAQSGFFRAAFRTPLRLHHIALVKCLLFLFREDKRIFALHTGNFYVGHRFFLLIQLCGKFNRKSLNVATILERENFQNILRLDNCIYIFKNTFFKMCGFKSRRKFYTVTIACG